MRIGRYILVAIIILLLAGFFVAYIIGFTQKAAVNTINIVTPSGSVFVSAEIAITPGQLEQGMMSRASLNENSGMFFVFPDSQIRKFWMKNMLIPLDIIFVSSNFTVVDIKKNFAPCQKDPCETYESAVPAQYVLEVNADFASRNNVSIGDKMREI